MRLSFGVDYIGGVDPYTIDSNIGKSIDFIVQLALDHNTGIDIHLHDVSWSAEAVSRV